MYNISFDFDPITLKVSNIKVENKIIIDNCDIELKDSKLILSQKVFDEIGINPGDRIQINYWTNSSTDHFPVIGKSSVFTDEEDGNRVTKSRTVSFRGQQHDTLALYGQCFNIEPFKEGMWKLVPIKDDLSSDETELNENEVDDALKDILDDLPF